MMTTTLKKFSALMLALGTIFILSFPSIAHAADTGGSDHFELTIVENKDSKSGAEIADLTIKNISGKTGTNVTFEADLPTIFHDKDLKKVTVNVGTLKAGDAKTYQVSRKTDGTVTTTPLPTTGATNTATKTSTPLPSTGEKMTPVLMVLGLGVLAAVLIIAIKHRKAAKNVLAVVLLIAGLGSAATVNAAEKTYHHRDEVRNHAVELGGTTHVFHLAAEGDFENDVTPTPVTYKMTFDSNGGSAVTPVTDIGEGATVTEPSAPSKTGYTFDGWYEQPDFSDTAWNFATDKMPAKDVTLYAKWTVNSYTVTFDSKGGDAVPSATVTYGNTVSKPSDPENPSLDDTIKNVTDANDAPVHDFTFKNWYTDEALTTPFDFDTPITADITLYAKWGLPIVELGDHDDGTLGTQFDRVWLSNSWWRVLKADMADSSNGNQALIIKEQALTDQETGDGDVMVQFDTTGKNSYFHDATTATGYGESNLKKVIDKYYEDNIASTYSNYVLPVDLDQPNWTRYSENMSFNTVSGRAIDYKNWVWQDMQSYYTDARFPISLAPLTNVNDFKQQAFALSYGDIQTLDKSTFGEYEYAGGSSMSNGKDIYTTLLDFGNVDANHHDFWLRSAGRIATAPGFVYAGNFYNYTFYHVVNEKLPVRPALAIQLD
ncbi:MAG: InlB B-repeat-containing protein [Lactococcus chungangensis]|nr:InlB B-repeat-containing protein [Lactococcus chungangensis]